jgi:hypothetical protein
MTGVRDAVLAALAAPVAVVIPGPVVNRYHAKAVIHDPGALADRLLMALAAARSQQRAAEELEAALDAYSRNRPGFTAWLRNRVIDLRRGETLMGTGINLIAAERQRQIDAEGWTPEHDAEHADDGLALAACCYAVPPHMRKYRNVSVPIEGAGGVRVSVPTLWPWAPGYWKPRADDRVRELVKAGALIAAEIDRLRAAAHARRTGKDVS